LQQSPENIRRFKLNGDFTQQKQYVYAICHFSMYGIARADFDSDAAFFETKLRQSANP
jgi:hypothetical protein